MLRRFAKISYLEGALLLCFVLFIGFIIHNVNANLNKQGIATGFAFLTHPAGFDIASSLIDYDERSTYGHAFLVGLLNTLFVSTIGILLATLLGFCIGILRLSQNWLVAKLAAFYIETIRNIPLLLQIFFWYFAVLRALPLPRNSYQFGNIYLNIRGVYFPKLHFSFQEGLIWQVPRLEGFNFQGGAVLSPEFMALLLALSIYTASFIAEIVRAGIQGVSTGQIDAAKSLGFSFFQRLRLIILPQALRIIIPPLTNQYLNLTKNSSLAAAIAYPELVSVFAGTVLNQTGQAVEVIFLTMSVYLTISLSISFCMRFYEKKHRFEWQS